MRVELLRDPDLLLRGGELGGWKDLLAARWDVRLRHRAEESGAPRARARLTNDAIAATVSKFSTTKSDGAIVIPNDPATKCASRSALIESSTSPDSRCRRGVDRGAAPQQLALQEGEDAVLDRRKLRQHACVRGHPVGPAYACATSAWTSTLPVGVRGSDRQKASLRGQRVRRKDLAQLLQAVPAR